MSRRRRRPPSITYRRAWVAWGPHGCTCIYGTVSIDRGPVLAEGQVVGVRRCRAHQATLVGPS